MVGEDVLKSEEIDWLVRLLSYINPMLEPILVPMRRSSLEIFPVGEDVTVEERALELSRMALRIG